MLNPGVALAIDAESAATDWKAMQDWQFGTATPIPTGGLVFKRDVGTFTLESGTVRLMAPAGGSVHGLVFEGRGTMRIDVPDRDELYQLRRFTDDPELMLLDDTFTKLYIRSSEDLEAMTGLSYSPPASKSGLAEKRQEEWLIEEWLDADARVITAALGHAQLWERIDVDTTRWSWLSFTYDSSADEEISVSRFSEGFTESWVSLQRAEDQGTESAWNGLFDIEHFRIRGDLTKKGGGRAVGAKRERPTDALLTIDVRFRALEPGLGALAFSLHPQAKDIVVKTEEGTLLTVIRDHLGARTIRIDKKYSDPVVTVVLDSPLEKDELRTLRFEYELEIPTFAVGDSWYPTKPNTWRDAYTASMEFTAPAKSEVKAMGVLSGIGEAGDNFTSAWEVTTPATMLTFCVASRFDERTVEVEGVPAIHSFGPTVGISNRHQVKNVGIDVANSLRFFSWLFETPLEQRDFWVTAIPSGHGQAFDGFLHLSEWTYQSDITGASELFRAHEVAHQWWGHRINWSSYRDQWISEAFAEYSAMMFVETTVKGGDKLFKEILEVYDAVLKGSISGGFSRFNRPWLVEFNPEHRKRVGPISHGWRASTKEIPGGYQIQAYVRGPIVIHMLRSMLRMQTGSDDVFIAILRDFVRSYSGKPVRTADFQKVVERNTGGDLGWFFDQWIHRSEVPHIEWSYTTTSVDDGVVIRVHMARTDGEGEGFILPIPLRVELQGGTSGTLLLTLDQREKTFEQQLPAEPSKVVFNPDFAVLLTNDRK